MCDVFCFAFYNQLFLPFVPYCLARCPTPSHASSAVRAIIAVHADAQSWRTCFRPTHSTDAVESRPRSAAHKGAEDEDHRAWFGLHSWAMAGVVNEDVDHEKSADGSDNNAGASAMPTGHRNAPEASSKSMQASKKNVLAVFEGTTWPFVVA